MRRRISEKPLRVLLTLDREIVYQSLKVLTTGGTIDKEYPQGVGGYAFEFGTVTAAQRIKKRTHSKFEIERICSVDSQGRKKALWHH